MAESTGLTLSLLPHPASSRHGRLCAPDPYVRTSGLLIQDYPETKRAYYSLERDSTRETNKKGMRTMKKVFALFLAGVLVNLVGIGSPSSIAFVSLSPRGRESTAPAGRWFRPAGPEAGIFTLYDSGDAVACREATPEEAVALSERDRVERLHTISPLRRHWQSAEDRGLRIVLRATQQLERFPQAKAAFLRAADAWEDKIQSPITVVIDVDFGPTLFGAPFVRGSIGASGSQLLGSSGNYEQVRARLIENASSEQELAVYNSLPAGSLPTDIGATTNLRGTSANARALGLLNPVADPDGAEKSLGQPPSIGFNSNFNFDYDPSDGIDRDKIDFDAVAMHEIGHVLGFISQVGSRELDSKLPVAPAVWDIFRLRPGADSQDLSTAQRILSSGGEQVFNAAGIELPLSTGRPNATGGDNFQASHWKNDSLIGGWYIGVMEVGIPSGKRQVMTSNDLFALQLMGYKLRNGIEMAPEPVKLRGRIEGDALTLTGAAVNVSGSDIQARVKLLDDAGTMITEYPLTSFTPESYPVSTYTFRLPGLSQALTAAAASITLVDGLGNNSITITEGILDGDKGGPTLKQVSLKDGVISIKGKRLTGQLSIEVNGVVVISVTNGSDKKLKTAAAELNLAAGPNRVRIIKDGLASNILLLNT